MIYDIFIIGGGVNGVAIARDAAGRGLSVALADKGDLAGETSSKATKLFHGGLRYLEYLEVRLVREALIEREILLNNMPHVAWPIRFVLPLHPLMRFENTSPVGKFLDLAMPWLKGRRPDWIIHIGLWFYDRLGRRKILPATCKRDLRKTPEGEPLKTKFTKAFEYSDVWAQDSRLVALMARDAHERGANIMTRNRVLETKCEGNIWYVKTENGTFKAARLVNAAGPWVRDVICNVAKLKSQADACLVRGSHIVLPKLFTHDKAYFFQGNDGRIIFAIPYEQDFTLIGTTDVSHNDEDNPPEASDEEVEYLLKFANQYFEKPLFVSDIRWHYSGVRSLYDKGEDSASAATREYVLTLEYKGAPMLNVFGGKITTHRKLAEAALAKLGFSGEWTHNGVLAGGDFHPNDRARLLAEFQAAHPKIAPKHAARIFACYGLEAWKIYAGYYGQNFGGGLYQCEVKHLMAHEFAMTAEDVLWRRTKLGLIMNEKGAKALRKYMEN